MTCSADGTKPGIGLERKNKSWNFLVTTVTEIRSNRYNSCNKKNRRLFGLNKIQNVRQMYEKFIQTKHLAVNFIQKFAHKYDLTSYYANIIVRLILQNHRP